MYNRACTTHCSLKVRKVRKVDLDIEIMARVFIPVANNRFDIEQAKVFGDIVYLSKVHIPPFLIERTSDAMLAGIKREKFDPDNDFLALTGNSITLALCLATFAVQFPKIKILLFDATTSMYCPKIYERPQ